MYNTKKHSIKQESAGLQVEAVVSRESSKDMVGREESWKK